MIDPALIALMEEDTNKTQITNVIPMVNPTPVVQDTVQDTVVEDTAEDKPKQSIGNLADKQYHYLAMVTEIISNRFCIVMLSTDKQNPGDHPFNTKANKEFGNSWDTVNTVVIKPSIPTRAEMVKLRRDLIQANADNPLSVSKPKFTPDGRQTQEVKDKAKATREANTTLKQELETLEAERALALQFICMEGMAGKFTKFKEMQAKAVAFAEANKVLVE